MSLVILIYFNRLLNCSFHTLASYICRRCGRHCRAQWSQGSSPRAAALGVSPRWRARGPAWAALRRWCVPPLPPLPPPPSPPPLRARRPASLCCLAPPAICSHAVPTVISIIPTLFCAVSAVQRRQREVISVRGRSSISCSAPSKKPRSRNRPHI